ncbi:hypothetical protein CKW39_14610 [Kocuria sp. WRN011]|uniref:heparan-alpha-glucosaminide N-acetyltransferase domain-containing protein n=1 Tax=Kocuria sp. WRN011 TaxID=2029858 RepID=UPI000BAF27DF|nr:heparan-alpha-glucosaminide N-acetyltransferase domain-containing protein [Kocuria sp. WRN011]PBB07280.1 hypothetical protein CKW39_14610 [Kocuria sp. WRN011]
MNEQAVEEIPEGYLAPGERPRPGQRPQREVWTGGSDNGRTSTTEAQHWSENAPVVTAPPRATAPSPRQAAATRNVASADGRRTKRRIMGVDVARGFALLGMIAVHTLPASVGTTDQPSLTWVLFGGHSAALFAVLAGVSLAFLTGGRNPRKGIDARRARVGIAVRALMLFALGLLLNTLDFPAYNILIYYGLMFLLAIPFTIMSVRWLLTSAALFMIFAPMLMQFSLTVLPGHVHDNANLVDLVSEPGTVLAELFLTGTYPALPWMAFICLGMALGRLPLTRDRTQILMVIFGAVIAAVAKGLSMLMLLRFDVREALVAATPWLTNKEVMTIQNYGPDPELPTTTMSWLLISGPHTNTPFAIAVSAGLAMVALGIFLLICRWIGRFLAPLGAMGSMTLTIYSAHLVFLAFVPISETPMFWLIVQIAVAALVATAWQHALGSGPLERFVTKASRAAGRKLVPNGQVGPRH